MQRQKSFDLVIGILGNPSNPDVAWSDEQLNAIKKIGVNTLQLSIAWSWRPANEVLNLEDLDDQDIARNYKGRVEKAHRFGFRALAHFGVPKTSAMSDAVPECIMDPEIIRKYQNKLAEFLREYDADDVLIYTYDQHAWLCSEFGDCPRCRGIPLHERLVPFLEALKNAMQKGKQGSRLWWEPWELSEGQIIEVVERISPEHFGLIMHNSIAEVYFVNTTDLAFRNIARLAGDRGIPFVGEGFFGGSGEDVETITHLACPRLVYQQLEALRNTQGVTGVKEYYGFAPSDFSANIDLFSRYIHTPGLAFHQYAEPIADTYGQAGKIMLEAWELISNGMEMFPFNTSWWLRFLCKNPEFQEWKQIKATDWPTPSWKSSRKGFYLVTDEAEQHPWLLEDVGLRSLAAVRRFERAAKILDEAATLSSSPPKNDIKSQWTDLSKLIETYKRFGENMLAIAKQREC
ncbi:MAG: hypothetical protein FWD61_08935 [Phycisphaerales bacterium]|nr:hypothetical protein [Phycisphaerales bacterium]